MDYILSEKEYFKDFIIGGAESVQTYVQRKRANAVWGDDVEIQALSEIYNRPIEIYAYSNEPMRTFHELDGSEVPFRLSYHGRSHYNSIVSTDWNYEKVFIKRKPGEVEDEAINMSKIRE
jgi:OTU domain-containing protein 5